jgi:non-ribosomal peptide synthetase component F
MPERTMPQLSSAGKLADADEPTASFGLLNVHGNGENLKEVDAQLDADLSQSVRRQARRMGVSAATLFHSCWALVIAQTSGRDDVIFGTVLLGRLQSNAGVQQIFGMFINTLPLRIELRDLDAAGLVARTQRELAELLIHEQASLSLAIRCSGVDGSAPLFTSLLNYRHRNAENPTQWSDAAGVRAIATRAHTNYPIALSVDDSDDSFALRIQTEERIDPRRILGYIITSMRAMLTALEQGSTAPALSLAVLPEEERRQVVELFNATSAAYPHRQSVSELFEEQAERTPNAVAVLHEDQVVTYAELNARANRLREISADRGVASGEHVPIHMDALPAHADRADRCAQVRGRVSAAGSAAAGRATLLHHRGLRRAARYLPGPGADRCRACACQLDRLRGR